MIKVMNEHREGGQVFWSARTKGCPEPFNWSIIKVLYIYSNLSMQGRFKMEYRLLTIVRYNYRDYNKPLPIPKREVFRTVLAYRIMKLIITEQGNNAWLAHGTPHLNVRSDFVDTETETGIKRKQAFEACNNIIYNIYIM